MNDLPRYMTPPQVAKLLGVDRNKIIKLIHRGDLRAIDVSAAGGVRPRWRISQEDFLAFLDRRATSPRPEQRRRKNGRRDGVIVMFDKE